MPTCAEYTTMLAEAQSALHKMTLGNKVAALRDGENSLEYSLDANIQELRRYVSDLQGKVDACNGLTTGKRRLLHFIAE